jgi:SAM-dependent methyltransferase
MMKNEEKLVYGNWVPRKMFLIQGVITIGIILLLIFIHIFLLRIILAIVTAIMCTIFFYFLRAYYVFSYNGGGLSTKIYDVILSYLRWDGNGTVLDIGCGSGALSIKIAKKYPDAKITGIDYWGAEWDYAQKQCQNNASLEGVSGKISFIKASASKLPFEGKSFDVVVSNFTFHEVKDAANKMGVIKEALRMVKDGGIFIFHDLFFSKSIYGDPDEMVTELKSLGFNKINLVNTSKLDIIPKFLRTSFMLGDIGILYGEK